MMMRMITTIKRKQVRMKKTIRTTIFMLFILMLTACSSKSLTEAEVQALPRISLEASFAYNVDDLREAVGNCDYVFTGKVISYDGVEYRNQVMVGGKTVGSPHTNYTIQVTENIQGKLITGEPIHIVKEGGVTQEGKEVYLFEKDELPETGKEYVFLGYAQPDGTIIISGPESSVSVGDDVLERYRNAVENMIIPALSDQGKYHSIYEEK